MQVIYLVRHGETEFNRQGRVQGKTESDLSDLGVEQARRLGERLASAGIAAAASSTSRRAVETARIAVGGSVPCTSREGLCEMHLGVWEGMLASEIRKNWPVDVKLWFHHPGRLRIEGAETIRQFRARIVRNMDALREEHRDKTIAVFTHGGAICTYLTSLLGMKLDDIWRFKIQNGSVTRVVFPMNKPRIELLGDIHHLDGVTREISPDAPRLFP